VDRHHQAEEFQLGERMPRAEASVREMYRFMQNSLCCGGGGGNIFTDVLGTGRDLSSRVRVRQALVTGAGTLVASCPQCCRMPDDAVKTVGLQGRIRAAGPGEAVSKSVTGA